MSEEEGVVNLDVEMSATEQQIDSDNGDGALSDEVISQNSQQNIVAADENEPSHVIDEDAEASKEASEVESNKSSKHSDDEGQLSTDNEEEEVVVVDSNSQLNQIANRNGNGSSIDKEKNYSSYNPPINAYNGALEYRIPAYLLADADGLDRKLHNIRKTAENLISQLCMFNERLPDDENFDIDEFSSTLMEMSTLVEELYGISDEFNKLHEKIKDEALQCLDKYENNANTHGGYLLNAKMNKSRQIRAFIESWQGAGIQLAALNGNQDMDFEDESNYANEFYDNSHAYQLLARPIQRPSWNYVYEPDLPMPTLPTSFHVAPTAHLSMPPKNNFIPNETVFAHPPPAVIPNDNFLEMVASGPPPIIEKQLVADLPPMNVPPPVLTRIPETRIPENREPSIAASDSPTVTPKYVPPPMISQAPTISFNTPPSTIAPPVSLPSMNVPPPIMNIPPPILPSVNLIPTNIPPPEIKPKIPQFQNPPQLSNSIKAPVLIPGLNIAGTAPLFAQASVTGSPTSSKPSLIPTQIPTLPSLSGANFGIDNFRKHNPQINPIINFNPIGSQASATKSSQSSTTTGAQTKSSHIPSLLDLNVAFPIEILKFNQTQVPQQHQQQHQHQRFTNRNRRSPIVNNESRESPKDSLKEKESQSFVKSDEVVMDTSEPPKSEATTEIQTEIIQPDSTTTPIEEQETTEISTPGSS